MTIAAVAAEPEIQPGELKRFPHVEAKDAVATVQIRKGFELQLAASEPLVSSPVAITFDERGRLFVVEMIDYPERRDLRLGRVRMLTDTDGDGRYDKATVYARGFAWPTGAIPWDGGIFVVATPDVLYFKDSKGDGVADVQKVVFTGLAAGQPKLNMQALANCPIWGFDNRIHVCTGASGGTLSSPLRPKDKPLEVRRRGFWFDPRTLEYGLEQGGGQYGIALDDAGRMYTNSNANHLQFFAWDLRYADNNPRVVLPPALVDIPVDGPAAEVFRISPEEPWRVVRTRWRATGAVVGVVEGGGRASGYFTSACGPVIYRGDAYPAEFRGDAFCCEPANNLVHRKKIVQDGAIVLGKRPDDEQKVEFLASKDTWFRPVWLTNGPDGCLWLVDMYREYIEHPWSLPPNLKKYIDLDSGAERGRLWRIAPAGFKAPPAPRLDGASTEQLVALLAHRDGWHRDTAARLLYQRQDKAAAPAIRQLLQDPAMPTAMQALYTLQGLGELREADVLIALAPSVDPMLNVHGLRLAESFLTGGKPSEAVFSAMARLVTRPPQVRQQLAFSLGKMQHLQKLSILAALAEGDSSDKWIRSAILSATGEEPAKLFDLLSRDQAWVKSAQSRELAVHLLKLVGAGKDLAQCDAVAGRLAQLDDDQTSLELAASLGQGMQQSRLSLVKLKAGPQLVERSKKVSGDGSAPAAARVAALALMPLLAYEQGGPVVLARLDAKESEIVQLAAIAALDRWSADDVGDQIIRRWPALTPKSRESALSVLIKRPARAKALLAAVQSGAISRADLATNHLGVLRQNSDKTVRELTAKVFPLAGARRQDVVNAYLSALDLKGDAEKGKKLHQEKCATCHRINNQGFALGPDLETVKNMGREKFLVNVLDPNRDMLPAYTSYIIETKEGDEHVGILGSESPTTVTLKMASGQQVTVRRSEIESMRPGTLSIMPEGLEEGLKPQDLADLMAFVLGQ